MDYYTVVNYADAGAYGMLSIAGTLGNIVALVTVLTDTDQKKHIGNTFLVTLITADLIVTAVSMPLLVIDNLTDLYVENTPGLCFISYFATIIHKEEIIT